MNGGGVPCLLAIHKTHGKALDNGLSYASAIGGEIWYY